MTTLTIKGYITEPSPLKPTRFKIDQALSIASDGFDAEYPSATPYLTKAPFQLLKLTVGYYNRQTGDPEPFTIQDGIPDEWTLVKRSGQDITKVKGRDRLAFLTEHTYKKLYCLTQPPVVTPAPYYGFPSVDGVPFTVGSNWGADAIAHDIVNWYGLNLVWDIPFTPYTLGGDFSAVGKPLDILRQLIAPYNYLEPFAVDVYCVKDTVVVRQRRPPFSPDYTISMHDLRVSNLTARARWLPKYNRVTILGKPATGGIGGVVGETVTEEVIEETDDVRDEYKRLTAQVVRRKTIRKPYGVTTHEEETKYVRTSLNVMDKAESVVTDRWYDIGEIGTKQLPNSNPTLLREKRTISGIKKGDTEKRFRELRTEETTYAYNEMFFQTANSTTVREVNIRTNGWETKEVVMKTVRQVENLVTEQVTSRWKYDPTVACTVYAGSETHRSSGLPPGGPRPPFTSSAAPGEDGAQAVAEEWLEPIAGDPTRAFDPSEWPVVDFQFSHPSLSESDLQKIIEDVRWASGKTAYEIELDLVACPWVTKGTILHITGVVDVNGTPITLQPALVDEVVIEYREGAGDSALTEHIIARFWA